jgi:hypothetical protein
VPQVRDAVGDLFADDATTTVTSSAPTTAGTMAGTTAAPVPSDTLTMLAITPQAEGSTAVFEIATNVESTVTVEITGGIRQGSTGTTHRLEFAGQAPGTLDWTATAAAPGQVDDIATGTMVIPYVYGRLDLVDEPSWVSNTTTTQGTGFAILMLGNYYPYLTYPQQAFLGTECSKAFSGPTVSSIVFGLEADGSGTVTIAAGWCSPLILPDTTAPGPIPAGIDLGEQVTIPPGWEPYEQEIPLGIEAGDGTLSLTVRIARVVSESPPP